MSPAEGLLEMVKFYFYLLFADNLHAPALPNHKQKGAHIWLLSAERIKVIFFLALFFFFNSPSTLAGFQFR